MRKRNYKDLIIKIVLIIVIILLLIHNCELVKKNKDTKIPTGNVDIIEIKCDKGGMCETEPVIDDGKNNTDANNVGNSTGKNNGGNSTQTEPTIGGDDEQPSNDFSVFDQNHSKVTWNGSTNLKIFTNSIYELDDVIAPESSNTYQFVVKNDTVYTLKYDIEFIETNPYSINMQYKLKKNDTYIIDHYVPYNELDVSNQILNSGTNDTYYLEWKWVSGDNDNIAGENSASYQLKIDVKAESTNG